MTENVTTTSATNAAHTTATATSTESMGLGSSTDSNAANRGLPYYEKLRRELRDTLQKKRLMDKSMAQLEDQIYRFEQSYLEETTAGNIIKGFDNYIKGSAGSSTFGGGGSLSLTGGSSGSAAARRKAQVLDADRVFSRSSASFMRDSPAPSSSQTTPSQAATPSSSYNGPASNKDGVRNTSSSSKNNKKKSGGGGSKNNNKIDDDGDDGDRPTVKRLKITYGRD